MFKLKSLIVFLACFCFSCNRQNDTFFREKLSLTGKEIKVKAIISPTSFFIYDTLLFVKERRTGIKSLKILSLNDFSLVSNAVWLGKGPGEMANPASAVVDEENGVLWYSDWGKYQMFKFPFDSIIRNPDFRPTESFKLKKGYIPMMNMYYNSSGYFGFSSFNLRKSLISFMDKNGELLDSLAIPNKIAPEIWEKLDISDNPIAVHYNPFYKKLVVAGRFENFISVIDEKGNPDFQIMLDPAKIETPNSNLKGRDYHSFYWIESDREFIYCLYLGGPFSVYDAVTDRNKPYYPKKLLIFDWQGKGRYEINLSHELLYFTLDSKRNRLIGNTQEFENGLIEFDLSFLKK